MTFAEESKLHYPDRKEFTNPPGSAIITLCVKSELRREADSMEIFNIRLDGRDRLPAGRIAVALGFFDGVHRAHRELISAAGQVSGARGAVLTFPLSSGVKGGGRLYTEEERLRLLEEAGAEVCLMADFSAVRNMTPGEFVRALCEYVSPAACICGYNFRFGRGAEGDPAVLSSALSEYGVPLTVLPEVTDGGEPVSTTRIKELISGGELGAAARLLALPYHVTGTTEHGMRIGTEHALPTLNTPIDPSLFAPPRGVYSSVCEIDGVRTLSVTNIGECPTFGARPVHCETHIIDEVTGDLYGKRVIIYLTGYLRPEITFGTPGALYAQIARDIEKTREEAPLKWLNGQK